MTDKPGKLIALSSTVMGSGKSEVANHLVTHHGFHLVKFAGSLKGMVGALLEDLDYPPSLVQEMLEGGSKEARIGVLGYSPRHLMQTLGTEWARDCLDAGFWVRIAAMKISRHLEQGRSVVVDDLRYPNELIAIQELRGRPYRVVRPSGEPYLGHSSEGALDCYPMRPIINDTTLEALYAAADKIAGER